jgi:hypothetical protein
MADFAAIVYRDLPWLLDEVVSWELPSGQS